MALKRAEACLRGQLHRVAANRLAPDSKDYNIHPSNLATLGPSNDIIVSSGATLYRIIGESFWFGRLPF